MPIRLEYSNAGNDLANPVRPVTVVQSGGRTSKSKLGRFSNTQDHMASNAITLIQ